MPASAERLRTTITRHVDLPFWLVPGMGPGPRPLLLWLHGAGGKGSQPADHAAEPVLVAAAVHAPWMTVACPCAPAACSGWSVTDLLALLDHLIAGGAVDPRRIIIGGVSMGGRGAYEVAYDHAQRLAGLIALAAIGLPTLAPRLGALPCWLVHGGDDGVVPVAAARAMQAALPAATYRELPGIGHNCVAPAIADAALWAWIAERMVGV